MPRRMYLWIVERRARRSRRRFRRRSRRLSPRKPLRDGEGPEVSWSSSRMMTSVALMIPVPADPCPVGRTLCFAALVLADGQRMPDVVRLPACVVERIQFVTDPAVAFVCVLNLRFCHVDGELAHPHGELLRLDHTIFQLD